MNTNKDQIYRADKAAVPAKPGSFVFDARVASVFADMISRSVPGYQQILEMLPTLTRQFRIENGNYYDLGCSLGAGMLAISEGLDQVPGHIVGVDSSVDMIRQAERNLTAIDSKKGRYSLLDKDLLDIEIESAAMVLMNFTLQFIPLPRREALVGKIYAGLLSGGILVLSEKIKFDNANTNNALIDIHHQYKADQGYSLMEISQKRDAIENVLIPETLQTHIRRLENAGFSVVTPWVQNLQFISILAIK
ncbi:MAG: carboxy-S-adenosyl-L-methionine synthase CmoA [Arenicella sp.]|nr:carboxy-S-adenosyl-L-methionine synthase CmoA [Arenicella sp.]